MTDSTTRHRGSQINGEIHHHNLLSEKVSATRDGKFQVNNNTQFQNGTFRPFALSFFVIVRIPRDCAHVWLQAFTWNACTLHKAKNILVMVTCISHLRECHRSRVSRTAEQASVARLRIVCRLRGVVHVGWFQHAFFVVPVLCRQASSWILLFRATWAKVCTD